MYHFSEFFYGGLCQNPPVAQRLSEIIVIEDFKSAVGNQAFGHSDAFGCLVVLHDGSYDARQCKSRTVQGMAELGLLGFCVAVTAFQTVCLIALEV